MSEDASCASHPGKKRTGSSSSPPCSSADGRKDGSKVKIEYDPEADALYIQVREVRPADNLDIEDGVSVDIDEHGHIVGLEILDASKRLSPEDLSSITIQKLPLEPTVP